MAIRGCVVCQGVREYYLGKLTTASAAWVGGGGGGGLHCHPPRRELIQSIHHTSAWHFTKRRLPRLEGAFK